MRISGWGKFPVVEAELCNPRSIDELGKIFGSGTSVIARGCGRAYGDSAINPWATISMLRFNRFLAFDSTTGQVTAEAGVLLADIISALLPHGWFPYVTPGTQFVTLGGMIAADVHGKNHHKDGSFGKYVDWIDIMQADGSVKRCSRLAHQDLFHWTIGGMGLTGVILRAAFRLRRVETGWIKQTNVATLNITATLAALEGTECATYSVAWVDCLAKGKNFGRSIVMLGDHATFSDLPIEKTQYPFIVPARRKLAVPVDLPGFLLRPFAVRAFNAVCFRSGAVRQKALVDWQRYFYPLDAIADWNRVYGRRGLVQFQCALPVKRAAEGVAALLEEIKRSNANCFLAVLKRLGPSESNFSFPMSGYTLALDFPVSRSSLAILERLDRLTIDHGGRFYLAKDSRLTSVSLRASDERVEKFKQQRDAAGWSGRFSSLQSERLSL